MGELNNSLCPYGVIDQKKQLFFDSTYIIGPLLYVKYSTAVKTTDKDNEVESTWYVPGPERRPIEAMDWIESKRKQKQSYCRQWQSRWRREPV